MKHAIATVSLGGNLREKLEAVSAAGFDGIEIFDADLFASEATPADVGAMVKDLGLEIVALQPFRDFEGMPEPQRSRGLERAKRKFDLMNQLGTKNILVCSNVSIHALEGRERAAADLHALGHLAASFDVQVGYEALAWGRYISDYRDAWEVVKLTDHPHVGIILDSFHILSRNLPLDTIRSIPAEKITFVQVADAPKLEMEILQWSRHFRNFPGQGDLPVGDFTEAVLDTGYDGWLSLEIFNDQFRLGLPRQVARDGHRSLIYLTEGLGGRPMPPQATCERIEFLEFALDDDSATALRGMFEGLGFHRAGTHKSKEVERWVQGDINLVINTENDGFAHAYNLMHGPSVCAVGLRLDDAGAALARAESLLADSFSQAVGPGELEVPAVRGPGGSLLYFTDGGNALGRIWDIEFAPESASRPDAGLTHIDHIAQSMSREEVLRWRLFYLSLFDFEKTPQVDIADPSGLVESQVIQSPHRGVRICLNASESRRTMASKFMAEYLGAGVQHIAFATDDIFTTVERLVKNDVALLRIPQNYYDDVEVQFGLDPDLIERMRALNILYDQDERGSYFQVYTDVFADRFFFEVVQRQSYDGYGAPNAPIRLVAQSRIASARTLYTV
ncbi:MAG: bifunctional sugar phosphate isomerase/epimerase/4-hydroxyphenylpyruvate dioxygenase family protein [Magnetospiraceae bacterium]